MKSGGAKISPKLSFFHEKEGESNKAWIIIDKAGSYTADIYYDQEILSDNIIMLVLTGKCDFLISFDSLAGQD